MSASNNFITRPVLTTVCSLLIVIVGLIAIPILPIENLPDIAPPTVKVRANYTGADAVSVEEGVTSVLEQQINGVENMDFIKSTSSGDGISSIDVAFASGSNGDINQVNVQNRVSLAEPQLPDEVRKAGVTVNKASNSILLVYNFGSEDPHRITYSAETISGLLDLNLTDAIKRVSGVGELTYFGNRKLAFRLWLDPDKLASFGLTSTDVVSQLESQNRLVSAGQVGSEPAPQGQQFTFTVQLQGRLRSVEDFESMVVRTVEGGGLVRLKDVGSVQLGGETYSVSATDLHGVPTVGLAVYQLSGSNALEVSDGVKQVLADFETTMPVGMKMEKVYDNTDFISASIQGVVNSLRDAVVLVVLILFLFLQNWKATLVPGIAIPVALIGTFGLVLGFGFSLNQLTLFGLVLATGLVVDDAITVIEDTSTKKWEGMTALEAAKATMDELFSAIIATSLVKFAVFLPVLFFPGATGTIYKQFAATVIFSIAISTFNALTFSPMLSALLLAREAKDPGRRNYAIAGTVIGFVYGLLVVGRGAPLALIPLAVAALMGLLLGRFIDRPITLPFTIGGAITGLILVGVSRVIPVTVYPALGLALGWFTPIIFAKFNSLYAVMESRYASALEWALSRRRLVMSMLSIGILLTAVAFRAIPGGFVPIEDQGYAIGVVQAPEGVSTQVTEAINEQVAAVLRTEDNITSASLFSGASLDGNSPNKGLFFFGTKNWADRKEPDQTVAAIVERLNQKLARSVDDARVVVVEPPAIPGYGTGGGFEFQLLDQSGGGYSLPEFYGAAGRLIQQGNRDSDLERVYTLFAPESPQIEIQVDRDRMAAVDVDFGTAMQTFSINFGGLYVNDTFQEGKVRRIYVQADAESRATPERLSALYVKSSNGELISLAEFFSVHETLGPTVVPHFNLYRAIKIEGTPAAGKSSGQAITAMKGIFETINPQGLSFDWTGISREEVKAGALAVVIFALGILAVYLVLSAQYESYADPLIILMTVPTAMLGALAFLALRGEVLNVYAQVGLVMLIGLAAGNGILIVDMANQRMQAGANALEAARFAAGSRLRPILMTAISSLFGFIPLVFASGAGARSQTSLGAVVFGGLLIATVLSLFVVPVFYVVLKSLLGRSDGSRLISS
ncbi:RND transporter/ hydrophobe/amphiphile efflux-1 family protein [Synechococcus sp. BIOS-U3-1]|uniref:efflux RND transporter permease subunit n=1 Tax=Synechococcus sp. BIOS-U3-1 TaxID=1400865 RepID=UPI001648718B|nr:efflux RND transporter permease subunit [Synechococcus sp. BIOS-U3-1]QNI59916.1 RND transporter/ hydrophobe/amphiphile efflux-1 family protein [Synechococcus sp. BIOS-U3-1]